MQLPQGVTVSHPQFGTMRATGEYLPDHADDQVQDTVMRMENHIRSDAAHPAVGQIAAGLKAGTDAQTVQNIFAHAKNGNAIRFEFDRDTAAAVGLPFIDDVAEVFVRPADMATLVLQQGQGVGDCDDFTMYVCSLMLACGVPCGIVTVAAKDSPRPDEYSHVYAVGYPMNEATGQRVRVPLDCSHGPHCGWEAPTDAITRKQEYVVSGAGSGSADGGPDGLHVLGKYALLSLGGWLLWSNYGPKLRVWWERQKYNRAAGVGWLGVM